MNNSFDIGDIVTRDGTDEHEVIAITGNDAFDLITVRCIKEPILFEGDSEPWIHLGEEEVNIPRRYSLVRKGIVRINQEGESK